MHSLLALISSSYPSSFILPEKRRNESSMRCRPFSVPIQTFGVRDAGADFDFHAAEDLLHCYFDSGCSLACIMNRLKNSENSLLPIPRNWNVKTLIHHPRDMPRAQFLPHRCPYPSFQLLIT